MGYEPRQVGLFLILLVTFSLGPSIMKLTILPALGLLLPHVLRVGAV